MSQYHLSETAKADLIAIADYGDEHYGEERSNQYRDALKAHFQHLADQPFLYPSVDHIREGYRRSVFQAHSIYYRVTDSGIEIMGIVGQQDAGKHLGS